MNKKVLGALAAALLLGSASPAGAAERPDLMTLGQGTMTLGIIYEHNDYSGAILEFRGNSCAAYFELPAIWKEITSSVKSMSCRMGIQDKYNNYLRVGWEPRLGEFNDRATKVQFTQS
ncbi:hypothetical protein AB0I52_06725 [Streptomyces sp. NPDC050423]|uniref:hypothetical protein n=1 Tax=Streptomyces sp. NPDC050423 TaxID=3155402 RepID=UPI0034225A15